jgi:serine/threonine-protein kinase HipA
MSLHIYRDGARVARLDREPAGLMLQYLPIAGGSLPAPLSASLPVSADPLRAPAVQHYFDNLLPEGEVRELLCRQFHLDATDDFGLLARIGAESAGALSIVPSGELPVAEDAGFERRYAALEDAYDLGQWLQAVQVSPAFPYAGIPTRLSLAGAQSKTAVARFADGRLHRSTGGATTHIVKLGSDRYPHLVVNEYLCARLAAACGLRIGAAELLPYELFRRGPPEYAYLIERHDRRIDYHRGLVLRLHQEDFCQALGRSRRHKYEDGGGIRLDEMFAFLSDPTQLIAPALDRGALLRAVLFNALIGNRDAHAKNYSLHRGDSKAELAPLYDLVCTEVYPELSRELPQSIGQARTLDAVTAADWAQLAAQLGMRPAAIRRQREQLVAAVTAALPRVIDEVMAHPAARHAAPLLAAIGQVVRNNINHLAA